METTDYRGSHLRPEHAKSYHMAFEHDPHRKLAWKIEKANLNEIIKTYYRDAAIHHLDFACGTGRILAFLGGRTKSSVGVDLSAAMLALARSSNTNAELLEADLTKDDVLGSRKFNLITAFRFFPNAQPALRREALKVLVDHLDADGNIVFNNHMNTASTIYRLARLLGRGGYEGMSMVEVRALVAEHDLEIVRTYHSCVLPATDKHMLLPQPILWAIEWVLSRIPLFRNLGKNLVFVCKHSQRSGPAERERD